MIINGLSVKKRILVGILNQVNGASVFDGCGLLGFPENILILSWWNTQSVAVAEEQNVLSLSLSTLTLFYKVAPSGTSPNGLQKSEAATLGVRAVVITHDWLDGLGSFISVIEWNSGDKVVKDMSLNDTMEELSSDKSEFTVDGSSSATGKVPSLGVVVGEGGVSVLEEGNGNQPVIHPEIWDEVPDEHVGETELLDTQVEERSSDSKTDIRVDNQVKVIVFIQRAAWVEVVNSRKPSIRLALPSTLNLSLVVVVSSNICDKVHWPSEQLLKDDIQRSNNGSLLSKFCECSCG